jgi:hypothetical protein
MDSGNITMASNATNAGTGTLTVGANLNLVGGSVSNFEITGNAAANTYDKIVGTGGTIIYGGTLNVSFLTTNPTAAGTYTLFSGSNTSTFSNVIVPPAPSGLAWHDYDPGAGVDYFDEATGKFSLTLSLPVRSQLAWTDRITSSSLIPTHWAKSTTSPSVTTVRGISSSPMRWSNSPGPAASVGPFFPMPTRR